MKSLFFLFLILLTCACGKRVIEEYSAETADQQRYFPIIEGKTLEYQVDSIVYDLAINGAPIRDSFTTFIKEEVGDTFTDNLGQVYHRIARFKRSSQLDPWVFDRHWATAITASQAIRSEDNLRFLRLVFPMDRRSEWNGNLWINQDYGIKIGGDIVRPFVNWAYEVDSIDIPSTVGAFTFDSTLVITEVDETNIIEKRFSKAIYAKGIGLVFKEQWILDSQYCNQTPPPFDCETKPWTEKAEQGYIYRQTILAY